MFLVGLILLAIVVALPRFYEGPETQRGAKWFYIAYVVVMAHGVVFVLVPAFRYMVQ